MGIKNEDVTKEKNYEKDDNEEQDVEVANISTNS